LAPDGTFKLSSDGPIDKQEGTEIGSVFITEPDDRKEFPLPDEKRTFTIKAIERVFDSAAAQEKK